ncbi:hypothetical protein SKAU_G00117990 [Synaphobranchus kaupii]|uniref:Uncharacterized protein n=1 Tax=Synaphobranchus kaupii TaxID=118154 RepID=A0A9Q1FN55_SYNKA|nr:hypothetical protein SKAU_G00117990 [Synaphobranchus kaupii]
MEEPFVVGQHTRAEGSLIDFFGSQAGPTDYVPQFPPRPACTALCAHHFKAGIGRVVPPDFLSLTASNQGSIRGTPDRRACQTPHPQRSTGPPRRALWFGPTGQFEPGSWRDAGPACF